MDDGNNTDDGIRIHDGGGKKFLYTWMAAIQSWYGSNWEVKL